MEAKEKQRLRYYGRKYGLCCRRVGNGYRFYRADNGALVDSVNGFFCNEVMTLDEAQNFFNSLNADKKLNNFQQSVGAAVLI